MEQIKTLQIYWEGSRRQWNLPNSISLSRAIIGVTMPLWWLGGEQLLLIVIIYAGVSDWLDGQLARWLGVVTPLGAVIDPLADKCFINPFLLCIAVTTGSLLFSLLFVVNLLYDIDNTYQRRFDILAAFRGFLTKSTKPVTLLSKTKTATLFVLMVCALYPEVLVSYVSFVTLDQFTIFSLILIALSWLLNRRTLFQEL
ncbi:MAG: phosphatidylglycerophosphate synthase [Candidatus Paceibacteria bacterium]|jgi:phosphatidylglycerophosphate synthase